MRSLVLILNTVAAVMSCTMANPQQEQFLRTNVRRHLQNNNDNDISTVEYCGQCIWYGNIVCEARAQYLVKNNNAATLQEARVSILDRCNGSPSDFKPPTPLEAFCGTCQWGAMDFDCNSRVEYLEVTYYLSTEKAKESLLEKGECVDVNYVPVKKEEDEVNSSEGSISNGAIIGILVGITILLSCGIGVWAGLRHKKKKKEQDEEKKREEIKLANTPRARKAKAKEIRQQILADIENQQEKNNKGEEDPEQSTETLLMNEASDTERSPSVLKKTTTTGTSEKRKSISFAPPVVWNITDDTNGPRPDPPSNDEIDIVSVSGEDDKVPAPQEEKILSPIIKRRNSDAPNTEKDGEEKKVESTEKDEELTSPIKMEDEGQGSCNDEGGGATDDTSERDQLEQLKTLDESDKSSVMSSFSSIISEDIFDPSIASSRGPERVAKIETSTAVNAPLGRLLEENSERRVSLEP